MLISSQDWPLTNGFMFDNLASEVADSVVWLFSSNVSQTPCHACIFCYLNRKRKTLLNSYFTNCDALFLLYSPKDLPLPLRDVTWPILRSRDAPRPRPF